MVHFMERRYNGIIYRRSYRGELGILGYRCDVQEGPLLNLQKQVSIHRPGEAERVNCIVFMSFLNKDKINSSNGLHATVHLFFSSLG
jgi:hypothetical protein